MDLLYFKNISPNFSSTEQEVDGETLNIMMNCATIEQLGVCAWAENNQGPNEIAEGVRYFDQW